MLSKIQSLNHLQKTHLSILKPLLSLNQRQAIRAKFVSTSLDDSSKSSQVATIIFLFPQKSFFLEHSFSSIRHYDLNCSSSLHSQQMICFFLSFSFLSLFIQLFFRTFNPETKVWNLENILSKSSFSSIQKSSHFLLEYLPLLPALACFLRS